MGRLNAQGNWLTEETFFMRERSFYDQKFWDDPDWTILHTPQDAYYFGVWYNPKKRVVLTFCEGDEMVVRCPTDPAFGREMQAVRHFYAHC